MLHVLGLPPTALCELWDKLHAVTELQRARTPEHLVVQVSDLVRGTWFRLEGHSELVATQIKGGEAASRYTTNHLKRSPEGPKARTAIPDIETLNTLSRSTLSLQGEVAHLQFPQTRTGWKVDLSASNWLDGRPAQCILPGDSHVVPLWL